MIRRAIVRIRTALVRWAKKNLVPLNKAIAGRVVLIDGTDIPTGERRDHDDLYSGKRHRCGMVIQVAADLDGNILAVSDPVVGKRHDRKALAEVGWEKILDRHHRTWIADTGYIGTSALHPYKNSKDRKLTDVEKQTNRSHSAIRSAVERAIAHLKNWKILATGYRETLTRLPDLIRIIITLEQYKTKSL